MLRSPLSFDGRREDETGDFSRDNAGSDCREMSCSISQESLPVTMHLLTNPGDSLLLQHTLDRLLKWVRPDLRLFHVSERACPLRDYSKAQLCPVPGYPSYAVTLFLHESYGEERILQALEFLQCPPWQYHHSESCGGRASDISSTTSPSNALLKPYLVPSRDFYSLGVGMPVWGVRTVHYGGEVVRITLHSTHDNFEDMVRLYETVLQKRAEEQKTGFCWFTLFVERGFSLQFAIKQLSKGLRVEPCCSSVLQFRVGEVGQLVPLLPNTCSPISATRWHTEDLDGNKILFQVKGSAQPQGSLTSAFPLNCPSLPSRTLLRNGVSSRPPSASSGSKSSSLNERAMGHSRLELSQYNSPRSLKSGPCTGSDSPRSTPPGSSCYSSQRGSPAGRSVHQYEPTMTSETSASCLVLQEAEPETNVDTGCAVNLLPKRPMRASALETLARDLKYSISEPRADPFTQTQTSQCHIQHRNEQADEFFI